jgi:NAD+ diphosphatase
MFTMAFSPGFDPARSDPSPSLRFAFRGQKILVKVEGGKPTLPTAADFPVSHCAPSWKHFFGTWNDLPCFALCLSEESPNPAGFEWKSLRELFGAMEEELVWVAGRASQLVHWHRNHRFCGQCGNPAEDHPRERAKQCPACGLVNHPRVSPAIIVAVVKDREILLAHATRFPAKFYSVLAGFVEPGESLEGCVRREVLEEVGVLVENIRYFGSQPWPFPDSLMVGFTAEYAGGELRPDPSEIADAGWFAAGSLPQIPPRISIARRLIDWFQEEFGGRDLNSEFGMRNAEK